VRVFSVCLAVLAGLAALAVIQAARRPAAAAHASPALQSAVDGIVRAERVPGAVLLVRSHGRTQIAASGLADVQTRTPMRPDTHFRVMSVTKLFTAAMALQLVSERKLSLDDTVEHWLPGLVPNGRQVPVRDLLNQTAGLPEVAGLPAVERLAAGDPDRQVPPRRLVRLVYATPVAVNGPGQVWEYSNTNYLVLGMIVEAASHESLRDLLASRIARPLGLSDTSIPTSSAMPAPYARGYVVDVRARVRLGRQRLDDTTRQNPSFGAGAGNMVSTAADLGRFADALLGGSRLLTRSQQVAMITPTRASLDAMRRAGWGYGYAMWTARLECGAYEFIEGYGPGYRSYVLRSRDGTRTAVLLLNGLAQTAPQEARAERILHRTFCR
jgi:D-alanyl-D-alanine carboxypeptidase